MVHWQAAGRPGQGLADGLGSKPAYARPAFGSKPAGPRKAVPSPDGLASVRLVAYRIDRCARPAVEAEVAAVYRELFPEADAGFVHRAIGWVADCFAGRHPDYQAIDLRYHDLEHTLAGALCWARLLRGRARAGAEPTVNRAWFELGLLAMLFHDTGYLKARDDLTGTGAKYTAVHVERSAAFARRFLTPHGYAEADTAAIGNMIRCTGVAVNLATIPFRHPMEQLLGFALGTADLLGQMAAPDYPEKLAALYDEFAEAARAGGELAAHLASYTSVQELRRRTPAFWEQFVWPRLEVDFGGLWRFLNDPFPDGPNPYLDQIQRNLARIRSLSGT